MHSQAATNLFSARPFPDAVLLDLRPLALNEANDSALVEALRDLVREWDFPTLYLNFASVRQVTPGFWWELIALNDALREAGRRLCLVNLTPALAGQFHAAEDQHVMATVEMALAP